MDDAALTKAVLAKYPQYSDLAAPPLSAAPGAPPKTLDSGEGVVKQNLTSFETQLANTPRNTAEFLRRGFLPTRAEANEDIESMPSGSNPSGLDSIRKLNPIVTTDPNTPNEHVDVGATTANVLPLALGAIGRVGEVGDLGDLGAKAKAVGKVAAQDAVSHVPFAGRIVQRPSIMDYVRAAQAKVPPEVSNPSLVSESRTLPGMNGPEVIDQRPAIVRAQPIPARRGLMLPAAPEEIDPVLAKLSRFAQNIQEQPQPRETPIQAAKPGRPLRINGRAVDPNTDLTQALRKSAKAAEAKKNPTVQ